MCGGIQGKGAVMVGGARQILTHYRQRRQNIASTDAFGQRRGVNYCENLMHLQHKRENEGEMFAPKCMHNIITRTHRGNVNAGQFVSKGKLYGGRVTETKGRCRVGVDEFV